jgi:hypothetical protein
MKRQIFLLPLLLLVNINIVVAQTPSAANPGKAGNNKGQASTVKESSSSFQLGNKTVVIPPPAGFEEATSQSAEVKRIFTVTEDPGLDLLAVHVPAELMDKIRRGDREPFSLYTKVSIPKRLRATDASPTDFSTFVSSIQTSFTQALDPDSATMKTIKKAQDRNLTELLEQDATIDFSKPINLGQVVKTPASYGQLLLIKTKLQTGDLQKEVVIVGGMGIVRVKQRIVFVYTYKFFNSAEDIEMVRAFTRKWLDEIVKAN